MRKYVNVVLAALISGLVALGLGCGGDDDGDGDGGIKVRPAQDGEYVGFLWKPKSESNGNLVVLVPAIHRQRHGNAGIYRSKSTSAENLIEMGTFVGDTHNGARPHFRFKESGSFYGACWFIVGTEDGTLGWEIPNGAQRWD